MREDDRDEVDDAGEDQPEAVFHRRSDGRFALVLVSLIAAWNVYAAFAAPSSREAIPPTLFVAGAIALGIAAAGPERFKVVAFFVGAAFCLAGFATGL